MIAQQQAGVALITALIFTALVTTFAVAIASQQQIDIRRTGNILSSDRGYLLALGIEGWARDVLQKDFEDVEGDPIDHLGEDWNVALPAIQVEDATVTGKITDLQGLINVNNLVDSSGVPAPVEVDRFRRLLQLFEFEPDLVDALIDWIDPDTETLPFGAEDGHYLGKEPPYRTANAAMVSISELRLVEGFDRDVYNTLRPFLAALPIANSGLSLPPAGDGDADDGEEENQEENEETIGSVGAGGGADSPLNGGGTSINVNTAPPEVLRVLVEQILSESEAESLIEDRDSDEGFVTIEGFLGHSIVAAYEATPANTNIDIKSEYFLIEGVAILPDARIHLFSVVHRNNVDGTLTLLMRGQGSY